MNSLSPKEAASLLRQKDNILILTHRRPDGDTTGCAAGVRGRCRPEPLLPGGGGLF